LIHANTFRLTKLVIAAKNCQNKRLGGWCE
jgi:hypothetical protein